MSAKVIQYNNYTITLSINGDEIYMKILDTINYTTYESSFDSQDLQLSNKLLEIYTMIVKTFEEEDGFNVLIIVESSVIKLSFDILLHSFYDINFVIVLEQKIISCDQELTLNLNKLDEKINMLLDRISILEKENNKLLEESEKEKTKTLDIIDKLKKENNHYIKCLSHYYIPIVKVSEMNNYSNNSSDSRLSNYLMRNYHIVKQFTENWIKRCNITNLQIICDEYNKTDINIYMSDVKYLYQLETLFFDNIHSQYVDKQKLIEELESDTLISITFHNATKNNVDYLECMKKCPNIRKLTITNATSYTPLIVETLTSYNNKIDEITIKKCTQITNRNKLELQNYCAKNKIKLNIS